MIKTLNNKKFFFISGLPRTGSTLLSSILCQNPLIHAEGNSALCQLMWDNYISCSNNSIEQLTANNHLDLIFKIISNLPQIYYDKVTRPIIIDKCRSWTLPDNINLIKNYIDSNYKMIILIRPIEQIIKSFMKLYLKNKVYSEEKLQKLLIPNSEPIMRSLSGVLYAKQNISNNNILFIHYDDLIEKPTETFNKIYIFLELEPFIHDFNNIVNIFPENDTVYKLIGMHDIRQNLNKDNFTDKIKLPKNILKICKSIESEYKIIYEK